MINLLTYYNKNWIFILFKSAVKQLSLLNKVTFERKQLILDKMAFFSFPNQISSFLQLKKKSETRIKTYDSCMDSRAWSLDNLQKSVYLNDIVHKFRKDYSHTAESGDGTVMSKIKEVTLAKKNHQVKCTLKLNTCIKSQSGIPKTIYTKCCNTTRKQSNRVKKISSRFISKDVLMNIALKVTIVFKESYENLMYTHIV